MKDLGLDSLDQVEIIMAMEDEFGVYSWLFWILIGPGGVNEFFRIAADFLLCVRYGFYSNSLRI